MHIVDSGDQHLAVGTTGTLTCHFIDRNDRLAAQDTRLINSILMAFGDCDTHDLVDYYMGARE